MLKLAGRHMVVGWLCFAGLVAMLFVLVELRFVRQGSVAQEAKRKATTADDGCLWIPRCRAACRKEFAVAVVVTVVGCHSPVGH